MCVLHFIAHLSVVDPFSLGRLDRYLHFLEFRVQKGDPHSQVVLSILTSFPVMEEGLRFKIKVNEIKENCKFSVVMCVIEK